jgi:hypothetical protein
MSPTHRGAITPQQTTVGTRVPHPGGGSTTSRFRSQDVQIAIGRAVLPRPEKLLLFAYASLLDCKTGLASPSVDVLAEYCGWEDRRVRQLNAALKRRGILHVVAAGGGRLANGRGITTEVRIDLDALVALAPAEPVIPSNPANLSTRPASLPPSSAQSEGGAVPAGGVPAGQPCNPRHHTLQSPVPQPCNSRPRTLQFSDLKQPSIQHSRKQFEFDHGFLESRAFWMDGAPPLSQPTTFEVRAALARHSVSGPNAEAIARHGGITPDAIDREAASVRRDPKVKDPGAVLAFRLMKQLKITPAGTRHIGRSVCAIMGDIDRLRVRDGLPRSSSAVGAATGLAGAVAGFLPSRTGPSRALGSPYEGPNRCRGGVGGPKT